MLRRVKSLSLLLLVFLPVARASCAGGGILYDHAAIGERSSFTVMGAVDLRVEKSPSAPVRWRTLNHEGGMKVRVLERLGSAVHEGREGQWLYVLLTEGLWAEDGEWLEKYGRFLIFLADDLPVYGFEE